MTGPRPAPGGHRLKVGVLGAGKIGGNLARLLAIAGHDVLLSFSRDAAALQRRADSIGVSAGSPAEAVRHGEVVVLSVPWAAVDEAIVQAGHPDAFAGRVVVDTTNNFGRIDGGFGVLDLGGISAARHNADKAPDASWVKAFNTLTAGFQAAAAGRTGPDRAVLFYATEHDDAVPVVEQIIADAGFDAVSTGTLGRNDVGHQEPKGDLYGEEFHLQDARAAVARLRGTPPSGTGRP
ncbi:MAG: NAD(P)-binding domain-containing protein [Geodermatophilaceae bacterium]|nr:NAD(P)-binding domain-containing protein [Geodermatophilaceae bacterium]